MQQGRQHLTCSQSSRLRLTWKALYHYTDRRARPQQTGSKQARASGCWTAASTLQLAQTKKMSSRSMFWLHDLLRLRTAASASNLRRYASIAPDSTSPSKSDPFPVASTSAASASASETAATGSTSDFASLMQSNSRMPARCLDLRMLIL